MWPGENSLMLTKTKPFSHAYRSSEVSNLGVVRIYLGELSADDDPDQLAFELHAILLKANHDRQLLGRGDAFDRARRAVDRRLQPATNQQSMRNAK